MNAVEVMDYLRARGCVSLGHGSMDRSHASPRTLNYAAPSCSLKLPGGRNLLQFMLTT